MVFKLDKNKEEIRSEWLGKANLLTETLPYMKRYSNKVIVVKFGGNAMAKKNTLIVLQRISLFYNK